MSAAQLTAPERFATLLQLLQRAVAACSAGGALPAPLIVWIWRRLAKLGQRFARLAARIEAGTFRPRRPYTRKPPERSAPREPSPTPQTFGWLIPLVPWVPMRQFWSGPARNGLQHLLNEPDMQELIAAAPAEMGRILRPLCWMLGLKPPPILARPRRPAARAPTSAAPPPAPPEPAGHPPPSRPPEPQAGPSGAPPPAADTPPQACGPPHLA